MKTLRYRIPIKGRTVVEQVIDCELDDIEWLIKNPIKDSINNYNSIDECKASQYLIYWGALLDENNPYIVGNYGDRSAIVLDYDGELTIEEFNNKFDGKFKYYLYTSIRHTPILNKFRVIIPTTEAFTMTKWYKEVLMECFSNVDPCTFHARGFYEPVKINEYYTFHISNGSVFDIDRRLGNRIKAKEEAHFAKLRKDAKDREDRRRERELMGIPDASIEYRKQCYIDKCIDPDLRSVNWGRDGAGRYHALGKIMYKMGNADFDGEMFDNDEIHDIIMPYLYEQKHKNNLLRYLDNR